MSVAVGEYKTCSKCGETKHVSLFSRRNRTKDGLEHHCKSCAKVYADSVRDSLRETDKRSYYKNQERRIAKSKKYGFLDRCKAVPESVLALLSNKRKPMTQEEAIEHAKNRQKEYKQGTYRERHNQLNREYSNTEHGKFINRLKTSRYRTRKAQSKTEFSKKEFEFLMWFQKEKCGCCHKEFSETLKPEIDHIIPVSMGGDLTLDNAQLLCRSCNASKQNKTIRYISEINPRMFEEWR